MAVGANTVETYDNSVIREDLAQQYSMISPEEVPFTTMIGRDTTSNTYHEWPVVSLAAPDGNNRAVEGDDDVSDDTPTLADRLGNYTQISDKVVRTSHTSDAVDAAAENVQKLAKQIAIKIRELKIDMETMLLQNVAAVPGSSGNARTSAGFPAFLRSNTIATTGGVDPTLSGTDEGYPNAAATPGQNGADFVESDFNDLIQQCWEAGADPSIAMVNAMNKRILSETFTGSSTRYKDAIDKTLVNAIDIYDSDFGQLTVVPNRFQPSLGNSTVGATPTYGVYVIDPAFASLVWLETVRQKPLAETGHSRRRLVWCEYTLRVDNEAAHGVIRDTNNTAIP